MKYFNITVSGSGIFAGSVWAIMKDYGWYKSESHDALLSEDINENGDYIEVPVTFATEADEVVIELNGERYAPYTVYEVIGENESHQYNFC